MPEIANQLSDLQVKRITHVGWHAFGGVAGLLLKVRKPATDGAQTLRSWILHVEVGHYRQPIGLKRRNLVNVWAIFLDQPSIYQKSRVAKR